MNWPLYVVNVLCLLSVLLPVPLYCLSVWFAHRGKPVIGGALALVKLLAAVRVSSALWGLVWDAPARGTAWRLFGAGHNGASVALFSALFIIGAACLLLNLYVLVRRMGTGGHNARLTAN